MTAGAERGDVPHDAGVIRRVCVFCGSRAGVSTRYREQAERLGRVIAREGWGLVYGGGRVGLMGAIADAVREAGGEVTGVIPTGLMRREVAHHGLTELREVSSMHERKAVMAAMSNAFLALPGGFGTLEEVFEAVTWAQLGIHAKPCVLLNVSGFFDPLIAQLDHAVAEGFLKPLHRGLLVTADSVDDIPALLRAHRPAPVARWLDSRET